jgi:hypothetical protein
MIHEVIKFLNKKNKLQEFLEGSSKNNENTLEMMKKIVKI